MGTLVTIVIIVFIFRFIFIALRFVVRLIDKKYPDYVKPTYPLEHEPPVFNQSYSMERPSIKKIRYSSVFPKSYEELKTKNKPPVSRNYHSPEIVSSNKTNHKKNYKPPLNLEIEYVDANGEYTRRTIRVAQYRKAQQWNNSIIGHCKLRGEERQFRYDRILSCVDADTGQSIPDVKKLVNDFYGK